VKQECRDGFLGEPLKTEELEGCVPTCYLDVLGLVTVAIGNLVDASPAGGSSEPALGLPFVRIADGEPATREEIAAEWQRVKATWTCSPNVDAKRCPNRKQCGAHGGWRVAKRVCQLQLTPAGVEQVVNAKLDANDAELTRRFPRFQEWPWQAQLATHSMAWACGAWFRFPRLAAALQADDFARAAEECHIAETHGGTIVTRNKRNKALYRAAVGQGVDAPPFDLDDPTDLQRALGRLGFDVGPHDGILGPRTRLAVKAFQETHGLTPDGVFGPKTRATLELAVKTQA
jgi:GH24 family phage-related lysozyme (muramidase)